MFKKLLRIALIAVISGILVFAGIAVGLQFHPSHAFHPPYISIGEMGRAYAETPDYSCDGVDDQVQINSAMTAASTGQVLLLPGNYNVTTLDISASDLVGFGPDRTRITATGQITIEGTGNLEAVQVVHAAAASYSGIAIKVQVSGSSTISFVPNLLRDVSTANGIVGPSVGTVYTGTGIEFDAESTSGDAYIASCTIGPICVFGYHYGLYCYSSASGGGDAWVNGNTFVSVNTYFSKHHVVWEAASGGAVGGNRILDLHMQAGSYTGGGKSETGLSLLSVGEADVHFFSWDWTAGATGDAVTLDASSWGNHIWGDSDGGSISNSGTNNVIDDYYS